MSESTQIPKQAKSSERQKVIVIHDASRNDGLGAIVWDFKSLPVGSGDEITVLGVIHQLPNPLGYRSKVDGSGSNPKTMNDELGRMMDRYREKEEVMQLSEICATKKIKFEVDVQAGSSLKRVAVKAVKSLRGTWVVLDRQMKKEKRYFMEKLTCGILVMKRDNTIEELRRPIAIAFDEKKRTTSMEQYVSYGEMIPGISTKDDSPKKTPSSQKGDGPPWSKAQVSYSSSSTDQTLSSASAVSSSSLTTTDVLMNSIDAKSFSSMYFQKGDDASGNSQVEKPREPSSYSAPESKDSIEVEAFDDSGGAYDEQETDTLTGGCQEEEFQYSVCSVCHNKRPDIWLRKEFKYSELYKATNGFSPNNFLSEGGFGCVYKGELKCGLKFAVKQHKDWSSQGEKEFKSEVNVLSKARHRNLVMLLGSCSEGTHRLLVYEYVCYGSLDQHLSRHAKKPLTWAKRIKIALGAARGLDYLHKINIIHRDMRPNNILVTHDYESLLGDFGLARRQSGDTDETSVVGSFGYVAPEYAECGKVSTKTDVYSFGVVLLQLITGCKTSEKKFQGKSLVEWARPLLEEKNYPDLIDERIIDSHDVHQLLLMVRLAERCLNKDPAKRDTMGRVANTLKYIMEGNNCNVEELSSPASLPSPPSQQHGIIASDKNKNVKFTDDDSSIEKLENIPAAERIRRRSRSWGKSTSHDHENDRTTNTGQGKRNSSSEILYTDMIS